MWLDSGGGQSVTSAIEVGGGAHLHHSNLTIQSTLRPTKCMTVECLRMLSITTLQTTIMTLQLFTKFIMTSQYYEYN